MKSRIFNTLSLISAILLACTIILWVWSFWADPRADYLSFSGDFHVGFFDGRIDFFSDKDGPYHPGSEISRSGKDQLAEHHAYGDWLGVFYRYFRFVPSGAVFFTFSVSLLYPMVLFLMLPITWAWQRHKARRVASMNR